MMSYLDLDTWPRRAAFEFFRTFDQPFFEITAPVEVGPLVRFCRREEISFSAASLFLLMGVVNAYEPFRYRLEDERVRIHDVVHPSTTERVGEEGLAFLYVDHAEDFATFRRHLDDARDAACRRASGASHDIGDVPARDDVIYFSALPWVTFTGLSHARNFGPDDSVPRITFGRYAEAEEGTKMPVSVEAHHALLDGYHAGIFFRRLERAFADPAAAL